MNRENTREIMVGNLPLGGNNKVYIQSMCTTKTSNVLETVGQIKKLEEAGCEIIRVSILDMDDAKSIGEIKKQINIPLVADIHFDYQLALEVIEQGIDKLRLNPGNITDKSKIALICQKCKERKIPIRIGVNSGSLPKDLNQTPEDMVKAALRHIEILHENNFYDIAVSIKASNVKLMIETYELASQVLPYPLHLGVTESGGNFNGLIKSSIGIGNLLLKGIGNTIRVSLSSDPVDEIKAAKQILKTCGLRDDVADLTSCPTCGRIQYDMLPIVQKIEKYLLSINKNIHVAVMGCAVNGPGEAMNADIGVAGGKNEAILFKKGTIIKKIPQNKILEELINEINQF